MHRSLITIRGVLASVAALFGVATIWSGGRVLLGSDPGYLVFQPLLVFNTAMGVAYVVTGVAAWRSLRRGRDFAAAIFVLNLIVLATIGYLYATGGVVAPDSLYAMTFRTVVWLGLFLGLAWAKGRGGVSGFEGGA